jgi:hypothetical protein
MMAHSDPTLAGVSMTIPVQFASGRQAMAAHREESARSGSSRS